MKVNVVSPWYPDYARAYSGIFVHKQVTAIRSLGHQVQVHVPQIFPAPYGAVSPAVITSMSHLAHSHPERFFLVDGDTTYLPCPVPTGSGTTGRAGAFASGLALLDEVRPESFDLTHAHLGVPTGWALIELRRRPLVVTEHNSQLKDLLSVREIAAGYRRTIEESAVFVVVSEVLRGVIARAFGREAEDKVEILPNIVDLSDIPFHHRRLGLPKSWVYVGGLFEHKGVKKLLAAFQHYVRRHEPSARMTLVGDGPLRSWIETRAGSNGIRDAVVVTGEVDHAEVGAHLAAADVYVHLSPYETFGISTLEAIGGGLPVVSLRNGGAESTWGPIEHLVGKLLPRDASPSAVANQIAALAESPSLDPARARAFIEESYSPVAIGARLEEIYLRAAG